MFKKKKKQKLTREQKAEMKKRKKRLESHRKNFKGQDGFFAKGGYVEYDGYVHVIDQKMSADKIQRDKDGNYIAVYDVLIQYGTNNPASIGWSNILIPSKKIKSGNVFFTLRERKMNRDIENDILGKKLNQRFNSTVKSQNNDDDSDVRNIGKRNLQLVDMKLAVDLASAEETIIDSDITLMIKAPTVKKLEKAFNELKQNYIDESVEGIILVRRTNQQLDQMINLFHDVSSDAWHSADMESVDASRLFLPSSGFTDSNGVFVGTNLTSILDNNKAFIDFNRVRNAVIITGHIDGLASINGAEAPRRCSNFGSAWAHVIAEDNYLVNGTRTHHITLVPFDYQAPNNKVFDMKKYSINALETYGNKKTVVEDANNNFDKVTEIIMMLLGEENPDPSIKAILRQRLVDWIINRAGSNGMYTSDPIGEPTKAYQILATTYHENYPTLQDFVMELTAAVQEADSRSQDEYKNTKILQDTVSTASKLHPSIFSQTTNIPDSFDSNDRNIYYDLSHVTNDENVKGAMFLNTLAYVTYRAKPGDMIVVHGIDTVKCNPKRLIPYRDKMNQNGIGLITTFEETESDTMNIDTLKGFCGSLSNQDIVVLGKLTDMSIQQIDNAWGHKKLPELVTDTLSQNEGNEFFVYRKKDYQSAIIETQLIL